MPLPFAPTRRRLLVAGAALALAGRDLTGSALAQPAARRTADGIPFPAAGRRDWAAQIPTLRIGISGGENEADRLGRYDGYRRLLEETFKVPVRLYPAADFAGIGQAFSAKQIDVAQMGAAAFAGVWMDTDGAVVPLVAAEEEDGSIGYVAVMVVRADSGITDLAGMKGKSLAWADPNSTSGYFAPRAALRAQGIPTEGGQFFSRTGFGGGHEQAVVAVLQRQYDAACTWASAQGDPEKGFNRGNLRAMVDKGMLDMRDLRVIWRSGIIPTGPVAARADLPAAFKADMTDFLLALPAAHPDIYRQIERGGGAGFRTVTVEDYALPIALRREEAAERRRRN
ncbi:phosphate/phosphite/phosphonate ABC transporter substrate-binding protein [Roseomonas sp. OT10]|uniref:phosphate/phosphite/phosphonate ABC transporter substrate-binding protein n=1 Tax=Roseomonas cutis TaxID=2897332 RepID=UPI001E2DDF0B|nr:phosphate/phosphite/phosphonate ABC transporter substrate-binding protein [Roseomonas sp. OT10]UFN50487.1 phosphate/phosphite/phosphonate ABC transporter substrate-binding protein [Roseomonas sp. OT10]